MDGYDREWTMKDEDRMAAGETIVVMMLASRNQRDSVTECSKFKIKSRSQSIIHHPSHNHGDDDDDDPKQKSVLPTKSFVYCYPPMCFTLESCSYL
jgi:hypothetical protein